MRLHTDEGRSSQAAAAKAQGWAQPRLLCMAATADSASQYIPAMNAIFAAQVQPRPLPCQCAASRSSMACSLACLALPAPHSLHGRQSLMAGFQTLQPVPQCELQIDIVRRLWLSGLSGTCQFGQELQVLVAAASHPVHGRRSWGWLWTHVGWAAATQPSCSRLPTAACSAHQSCRLAAGEVTPLLD